MKKNSIAALLALVFCAAPAAAQKKYGEIRPDTAKVRFVRGTDRTDAYIFDRSLTKNVVYVNEEVTTHIIMPENIRLVDISTDKIVGNQCADNIVRIKPAARLYDNELAGTVTVIGELTGIAKAAPGLFLVQAVLAFVLMLDCVFFAVAFVLALLLGGAKRA